MGAGLFARYPEIVAETDAILGYSVAELCLADPGQRLADTRYTQPALYVVNALAYRSRCDGGAPPPDFLAGHSLGEYNALLAAEVFDFATGLRLVQRRGELMGAATGGGMVAVIGCDEATVEGVLSASGLSGIEVANYNGPYQVVLSGPNADLARLPALFDQHDATCKPLKVSAAFHSRSMEELVAPLGQALEGVDLRPPRIPVLSNVSARPYAGGEIRDHLRRQIREPVRWTESIRYLLRAGIDDFEEVGPGEVLTKLIKAIRKPAASRPVAAAPARPAAALAVAAECLGAESFRRDYGVRRAYAAGSMDRAIASEELVIRMGKAGYLSYFGAAGLGIPAIAASLRSLSTALPGGEPFGVGLRSVPDDPQAEMAVVEVCLEHGVRFLEAAGHVTPSPALVRYRLQGLSADGEGRPVSPHKVLARVSRPEVAAAFLAPAPEPLVAELAREGSISGEEARLARWLPMADDLSVEADLGEPLGDTAVLLPAILRLRDEACRRHGYGREVRVGCGGEIGTPEAAAAAFLLGADFLLTGWLNQCTVEAGTSQAVKDVLETVDLADTDFAPAGDLFELGAKVQVVKKGILFPARANRLHDLWRRHGSWEEIDAPTRAKIERDCFGRSFERVVEELRRGAGQRAAQEMGKAARDGRHRMALVFRWYCERGMDLALSGAAGERANYQIRCGPALGAFNRWVQGTAMERWRDRHADAVADEIMAGAARVLARTGRTDPRTTAF